MAHSVEFPKSFSDRPNFQYLCPECGIGFLVPERDTFKSMEPAYSRNAHTDEDFDADWITYRFTLQCVCSKPNCGEIAFVSGAGRVDQRYGDDGGGEYFDHFFIESFFPSPHLCQIPSDTPATVEKLLLKSFSLYWVDTGAAANALRASLEALLGELNVPSHEKNSKGETVRMNLHRRLDAWSATEKDHAELCLALKEVGNLGSHGETVNPRHYFGSLEIYSHVLRDLFENNSKKMKELAQRIRNEIMAKKHKHA